MMNYSEYKGLVRELNIAGRAYAKNGNSHLSDEEYDLKYIGLKQFEYEHPDQVDPRSPSLNIADDRTEGFSKVTHSIPMISISNAYDDNDVTLFYNSMSRQGINQYVIENKIDGCALSLIYENGELITAVTRGNGIEGDDVTENAKQINSIPNTIPLKNKTEIRGEVYWELRNFEEYQDRCRNEKKRLLKNPRNGTAGTLKLHDTEEVGRRKLSFLAYSIVDGSPFKKHSDDLYWLNSNGFTTSSFSIVSQLSGIIESCKNGERNRNNLPFDIDGMVIKVNDKSRYSSLGGTSKSPNYLKARKFPPEEKNTKLIDIEHYTSPNGIVTPVAIFEPIELAGTTVRKSTLHNWDMVSSMGFFQGCEITVRKQGDIIPQVAKVVSIPNPTSVFYSAPINCPICGDKLEHPVNSKGEVLTDLKCINPYCDGKAIGKFLKFVSRKAMNIDGVGEAILTSLYEKRYISSLPDLYEVTSEQLQELDKVGKKTASNFINSVNKSKSNYLHQLLTGFNIPNCGESLSKRLASYFETLGNFKKLTKEELLSMDDVGEETAKSITNFIESNSDIIEYFEEHEIATEREVQRQVSSSLEGKVMALTGKSSLYSKKSFQKAVEENGGEYSSTLKKNVTHLVSSTSTMSNKMKKAMENGTVIITDEEFSKMLN